MTDEQELYQEGDALSKQAVSLGVPITQLKDIFGIAQKKPRPFLEAQIKRQVGRRYLRETFGNALLATITKHAESKGDILSVLRYIIMTYDYNKMSGEQEYSGSKRPINPAKSSVPNIPDGQDHRGELVRIDDEMIARVIRPRVAGLGFKSLRASKQGDDYMVTVRVERFPPGNPGLLARELAMLIKDLPEFKGCFVRVMFETERR